MALSILGNTITNPNSPNGPNGSNDPNGPNGYNGPKRLITIH